VKGVTYGNPNEEMFLILPMFYISGPHGDEYENDCLLECCTIPLMMGAVNTSETSVNFYQTKRRNIPEKSSPVTSSLLERNVALSIQLSVP
jgi:hypothetical protein